MKNVKGIKGSFLVSLVVLVCSFIAAVLFLFLWIIPWARIECQPGLGNPSMQSSSLMILSFSKSMIFTFPLIIAALAIIIAFGVKAKNKTIYSIIFNVITLILLIFIFWSYRAILAPLFLL